MTDASATLLHAVYQYRTLLMRAYFRGDALRERDRASLAGLDRSLGIDSGPTDWLPRQFRRVGVRMQAGIIDGSLSLAAHSVNLGAGGVRLDGVASLPSHRIVTVRLDGPRDYRFPARTVWFSREATGAFSIGLVFVGAPVELRRRVSYDN